MTGYLSSVLCLTSFESQWISWASLFPRVPFLPDVPPYYPAFCYRPKAYFTQSEGALGRQERTKTHLSVYKNITPTSEWLVLSLSDLHLWDRVSFSSYLDLGWWPINSNEIPVSNSHGIVVTNARMRLFTWVLGTGSFVHLPRMGYSYELNKPFLP